MGWFSKPPAVVKDRPEPGTPYTGGKTPIFREGFYYLCDTDADGNELDPDTSVPLLFDVDQRGFVYARSTDNNHFHTHGIRAIELNPGSED